MRQVVAFEELSLGGASWVIWCRIVAAELGECAGDTAFMEREGCSLEGHHYAVPGAVGSFVDGVLEFVFAEED